MDQLILLGQFAKPIVFSLMMCGSILGVYVMTNIQK